MSTYGRRVCAGCGHDLDRGEFSRKQWAKGGGRSRCAQCMYEGVAVSVGVCRPWPECAKLYVARTPYISHRHARSRPTTPWPAGTMPRAHSWRGWTDLSRRCFPLRRAGGVRGRLSRRAGHGRQVDQDGAGLRGRVLRVGARGQSEIIVVRIIVYTPAGYDQRSGCLIQALPDILLMLSVVTRTHTTQVVD